PLDPANGTSPGWLQGVRHPPQALDCRAHFCLAGKTPTPQQGLRTHDAIKRGIDIHQHDLPHVPTPRTGKNLIHKHVLTQVVTIDSSIRFPAPVTYLAKRRWSSS